MRVCMLLYMHVLVCMCAFEHMSVIVRRTMCVYAFVGACACVCVRLSICVCMCSFDHMRVHVHVSIFACVCVHVYVHDMFMRMCSLCMYVCEHGIG